MVRVWGLEGLQLTCINSNSCTPGVGNDSQEKVWTECMVEATMQMVSLNLFLHCADQEMIIPPLFFCVLRGPSPTMTSVWRPAHDGGHSRCGTWSYSSSAPYSTLEQCEVT